MKRGKLTIALIAGLMTAAFGPNSGAETLKFGIIGPLTGPAAIWGQSAAGGAKIAASEINAKGGLDVGGKKYDIEIISYDDQYKAPEALTAYGRMVNKDGVKMILVLTSASTLAVSDRAESDGVILMTGGFTEKPFNANTKYIFRLWSPGTDFLGPYISWMRDNLKQKSLAIINPNDETGWALKETSEKVYKQNGFNILANELYERSIKDFQPLLTKIISNNIDIIDLGASAPATAGLLVRQARELGYKGVFVKTGGAGPKEIVDAAGIAAAEGTVNQLYADPANAGYQRLIAEYKKQNGVEPNELIVSYYDATKVLAGAVQAAGVVDDTAKIAASFGKALPMQSVQGDKLSLGGKNAIGTDHQVMTVNYIGVIRKGEVVVVGKMSSAP